MDEILAVVEGLGKRCEALEEEIKILRSQSKPFTSQDYIRNLKNENGSEYEFWKQKIKINNEHIKLIYDKDACFVYSKIIEDNFNENDNCLRAFNSKKSIFIFKDNNWKLMSKVELNELITFIYNKIMKTFNENKNLENNNLDYLERVQKLMEIKKITTSCFKNKLHSILTS